MFDLRRESIAVLIDITLSSAWPYTMYMSYLEDQHLLQANKDKMRYNTYRFLNKFLRFGRIPILDHDSRSLLWGETHSVWMKINIFFFFQSFKFIFKVLAE